MELLPEEILRRILTNELDKPNQLNASMTCRKWLTLLEEQLPRPLELHVTLDSVACNARIWLVEVCCFPKTLSVKVTAPITTRKLRYASAVSIAAAKLRSCANFFNSAATGSRR